MKKFIIIGPFNVVHYKEIFPLMKNNELWLGVTSNATMEFRLPEHYTKWNRIENGEKIGKVPAISWYTNIENKKRNTPLDLYKRYSNEYPKFDNYDAINVDKVCEIPMDYEGIMGVPITFFCKYCPEQFEIVGFLNVGCFMDNNGWQGAKGKQMLSINGKNVYSRILIRKRN